MQNMRSQKDMRLASPVLRDVCTGKLPFFITNAPPFPTHQRCGDDAKAISLHRRGGMGLGEYKRAHGGHTHWERSAPD